MVVVQVSNAKKGLKGEIVIPSDKSISHRAIICASLSNGKSLIKNFSQGADPHSTLNLFANIGVEYKFLNDKTLEITSNGRFKAPSKPLDCGNSGSTMCMCAGILAGQNFKSTLIGDESLSKRTMTRICEPLSLMDGKIYSINGHAPLIIEGTRLHGIEYKSKIASAQVKSCLLFAGLNATDSTTIIEPYQSRNHTEIMLKYFGADIESNGNKALIYPSILEPREINISGDISSAAFFIVAGLIVPNSDIILKNVGLNPTRCGILEVAKKMGGQIEILDKKEVSGELTGDLRIKYSELKSCEIKGEIIPKLIDELPVIAVLATQANGETVVQDAQDLRNKETDRISSLAAELRKLGIEIEELPDGFKVQGKQKIVGGVEVNSHNDHRLAMSLYIAGLVAEKPIFVRDFEWVNISFPEFEDLLTELQQ